MSKYLYSFVFFFHVFWSFAQEQDTVITVEDSLETLTFENTIINSNALSKTFLKLRELQSKQHQKVRMVHIGDSHIQADIFTNTTRLKLQDVFGNGGLGFTFPYSLAGTHGPPFIRYQSTKSLESYRNIKPKDDKPVGLSGIALFSNSNDFVIEMQIKDPKYAFHTIKVITPKNKNNVHIAFSNSSTIIEKQVPKKISHKIKKGEVLGTIAKKYGVTISELKKANRLTSDRINFGKILVIPTDQKETIFKTKTTYTPLQQIQTAHSFDYHSNVSLEKLFIIPNEKEKDFALNGIVLENENTGITYSSIGVNGAKCSDFNKYDAFYEQLPALGADLVLISLGTNESFDKLETQSFFAELTQMVSKIRKFNPATEIVVMTPPPSQFRGGVENTFVGDYTKVIKEQAQELQVAVWDLYEAMGGIKRIKKNVSKGIMAKDKIHFTKEGYQLQGELFFKALMQSFESIKNK